MNIYTAARELEVFGLERANRRNNRRYLSNVVIYMEEDCSGHFFIKYKEPFYKFCAHKMPRGLSEWDRAHIRLVKIGYKYIVACCYNESDECQKLWVTDFRPKWLPDEIYANPKKRKK